MYKSPFLLMHLRARLVSRLVAILVLTGVGAVTVAPVSAMIAGPAHGNEAQVHHGFSSPTADMFTHLLTDARLRSAVISPRPADPGAQAPQSAISIVPDTRPASGSADSGAGDAFVDTVPPLILSVLGRSSAQPLGP